MSSSLQVIVFLLAGERHAVRLAEVEHAVRAAHVTAVADAPAAVLGLLDVAGSVLPVLSLRRRMGGVEEAIHPDQHFLIVRMGMRRAIVVVDEVLGLEEVADLVEPHGVIPGLERCGGIARLPDGLLLIHDLEQFFSPEEWRQTERVIADVAH